MTTIKKRRRSLIAQMTGLLPKLDRVKYSIKDLKKGSFTMIGSESYFVDSISTYTEVKWKDFSTKNSKYVITELELFCISNGKTVFLEWEEDDTVEAYITTKEVSLRDIRSGGIHINKKMIENISEEEEGDLTVSGAGSFWYDEDSTYAALYNSEKHTDVPVKMFEFGGDGKDQLTVEFWYDDASDAKPDREAYLSQEFDLKTIEVLKV